MLAPERKNENIVLRRRPGCAQLFFVYAGARGLPGLPAVAFLTRTGLADRNLVLLRDPYLANFAHGVGGGIDDLDALLDWQCALIHAWPEVEQLYCIGNSMGAYAAMLLGERIGAAEVFAFSLEIARGKDPHALHRLSELLEAGESGTHHHLYFLRQDEVDTANAESLAGIPGVHLHPLDCVEGIDGLPGRLGTHQAMNYLAKTDRLRDVFPPFVPARARPVDHGEG